jgi:hypothetical protein
MPSAHRMSSSGSRFAGVFIPYTPPRRKSSHYLHDQHITHYTVHQTCLAAAEKSAGPGTWNRARTSGTGTETCMYRGQSKSATVAYAINERSSHIDVGLRPRTRGCLEGGHMMLCPSIVPYADDLTAIDTGVGSFHLPAGRRREKRDRQRPPKPASRRRAWCRGQRCRLPVR